MRSFAPSSITRLLLVAVTSAALFLSACGGGGGASPGANLGGNTGGNQNASCINCDLVDGVSYLGSFSDSGGGDGGGDGGAGGGAGDGVAIANAPITLTDAKGAVKTQMTKADGTFYFVVTGMTAPLVVKVTKPDGTVRMSFTRLSPVIGKVISISVSGLSDKIASDVVTSVNSAAVGSLNLTPAMVSQAAQTIPTLVAKLNASIAKVLTDNGLDPAKFDPMAANLVPASATSTQNNYDKVLDALAITPGTGSTPTVIMPPLDAVKALFKNLRSTVGAYSKSDNTGDLDVADQKLRDAAHATISPIDNDTLRILGGFFKAETMYTQYKSGASTTTGMSYGSLQYGQRYTKDVFGNPTSPSLLSAYGCDVQKISLLGSGSVDLANTRSPNALTIGGTSASPITTPALPASQVNGFFCYGSGTQGRLVGTLLSDGMARANAVAFLPQTDGSYKYISLTGKYSPDATGAFNTSTSSFGGTTIDGAAKFGTLTPVRNTAGQITSFTITGDLRPGFATMPDRNLATWQSYAGYTINLTAAETSTNTTKTQTFSGSVALNKADGTIASTATIGSGSTLTETLNVLTGGSSTAYLSGSTPCATGYTQIGVSPNILCSITINNYNQVISAGTLNVAIAAPGIKFEGVMTVADASEDKTGTADTSVIKHFRPNTVSLNGKLYDTDSAGAYRLFFNGTVSAKATNWSTFDSTLPESSTNFLLSTIGLDGKIYLVNRPEISAVLNLTKTGYKTGTTSGSFKWSDATGYPAGFAMTGAYDDVAGTGSLSFTSTDVNATFTIPRGGRATGQKIYVNGIEQGTITISTKRIDYKDGTFEQF
jgi:hypothetical protein